MPSNPGQEKGIPMPGVCMTCWHPMSPMGLDGKNLKFACRTCKAVHSVPKDNDLESFLTSGQ